MRSRTTPSRTTLSGTTTGRRTPPAPGGPLRHRPLPALAVALLLVAVALTATTGCSRRDPVPREATEMIGRQFPELQVRGLEGTRYRLRVNMEGRPSIVSLWATWCEPCREELPLLAGWATLHRDDVWLYTINTDDRRVTQSDIEGFIQELDVRATVLRDPGHVLRQLGVTGIPTTFLINGDGVVIDVLTGFEGRGPLFHALDQLLESGHGEHAH